MTMVVFWQQLGGAQRKFDWRLERQITCLEFSPKHFNVGYTMLKLEILGMQVYIHTYTVDLYRPCRAICILTRGVARTLGNGGGVCSKVDHTH